MTGLKETPLTPCHKQLGAKLVDFNSWNMPVSYSSVIKEHEAVRERCGLFDVSHMGEIFIEGSRAIEFCQKMTINDVTKLNPGMGQYSAILNENGGMIDDLIIYRLAENTFLLCVNAGNVEKDYEWIKSHASQFEGVTASNKSTEFSQIAVQGPESPKVLTAIFNESMHDSLINLPYTNIMQTTFGGEDILIARTGYTGEKGYEIYAPNSCAEQLWTALMETGLSTPCGLGARDTLRLEACYLLYGQDMNEDTTPLHAGIGWATKLDGDDFIGKTKLLEWKDRGLDRRLVAFKMEDKGIARGGMDVQIEGKPVGKVTSGSFLPTLQFAGGLAILDKNLATPGQKIFIDVRGKLKAAQVVKKPLYSAKVK